MLLADCFCGACGLLTISALILPGISEMRASMPRSKKPRSKMSTSSKSPTQAAKAPVKLAVVKAEEAAAAALEAEAEAETGAEPEAGAEGEASLVLRKKDFVERVMIASGVKKPVARDVSEAVLKVLGEALDAGETMTLPPLGKIRVTKHLDKQGGEVLQVKIKRLTGPEKKDEKTDDTPLAEGEE